MYQTPQPVIGVAKWIVDRRAEHVADVDGRDDAHALHDDKVVEHPGAEGHVDPGEGDDGGHGVGPVVRGEGVGVALQEDEVDGDEEDEVVLRPVDLIVVK